MPIEMPAPVADQIQPPNLQQGLGTLSSLLGLKQQQIAIATGQAQQQTAQAAAQQAQQQNQELQGLGQFFKGALNNPAYFNVDGSVNIQKLQQDAMTKAPVYGQQYIEQMTAAFNGQVQNRKALLDLSADQRQSASGYLAAFAADPRNIKGNPNYDPGGVESRYLDTIERARSLSQDPGYQRALDGMLMHSPSTATMTSDQAAATRVKGAAQASQVAANPGLPNSGTQSGNPAQDARNLAVATGAPGADLSGPAIEMVQGPKGLVPTNVNPQSPMGTGAVGAPIPNAAPPAIVTPPGGIPTVTGPGGTNPRQVPGTGPGPNPTSQDWENFGAYQTNLNARVAIASDSIPRIQQAEQALAQIRGGAGAQGYARLARIIQAVPGMPQSLVDAVGNGNLGAAQEAEKYLFQTTFSGLRQSMQGDPARVAEFQSAEQIFPSIGTDPRAATAVLNFMKQQGQRDYAEQQALNTARKNGTFNPATWQADYQAQLRAGKVPGVPTSQVPGSAPQDGTTGKSKSGRAMVYRNGQWEYQ